MSSCLPAPNSNPGLQTSPVIIIIMYIYHALINALSAHIIHRPINLNTVFYTDIDDSPTKTIYIRLILKLTNLCTKTA